MVTKQNGRPAVKTIQLIEVEPKNVDEFYLIVRQETDVEGNPKTESVQFLGRENPDKYSSNEAWQRQWVGFPGMMYDTPEDAIEKAAYYLQRRKVAGQHFKYFIMEVHAIVQGKRE
jgi:hypothetical protein